MMKRNLVYVLAVFVSIGIGVSLADAGTVGPVSMNRLYEKIFADFRQGELKTELILMFEQNFTELMDDIQQNTTPEDEKPLIDFLTMEFNHYTEALHLKQQNPEEFNNWVAIKQKDYRCMILGRKIQSMKKQRSGNAATDALEKELKALLAQVLAAKLAKEQEDITDLEKQLLRLKTVLQIRKKNKDKILRNRYDELVGNQYLYRW